MNITHNQIKAEIAIFIESDPIKELFPAYPVRLILETRLIDLFKRLDETYSIAQYHPSKFDYFLGVALQGLLTNDASPYKFSNGLINREIIINEAFNVVHSLMEKIEMAEKITMKQYEITPNERTQNP